MSRRFLDYMRLDRKRGAEGLTLDELRRWRGLKRLLSREFHPEVTDEHADRRESVRVPTRVRVSFASSGDLAESLMTNLSRAGLFLRSSDPIPIGTRLSLRIHIEKTDDVIDVDGEVVSHNVGPNFSADEPGIGLRFIDPGPDVEKQLADLYENSLRRAISFRA